MHTLYFKMLFDERNLKNIVYKLSGGAEMFYRKPSLKRSETTIHNAHEPLENKNPDNVKKQSIFDYELVKDKRFTKRQFSLHIPIMLNFQANDSKSVNMNKDVREVLKGTSKHHIIGIDRGERNLVYVSVIDETGKIRMQKSFNIIESDNNYKVNYNSLLDARADINDKARKSWKSIENIKDLKEGYVSQVVHEICKLVVEYDAIIALENLSDKGFINSRKKVEKQVYQKFEDMLVHKLQFLTDKSADIEAPGGLLHAYQLTENPENYKSMVQNGIVFYVPAWLTSKIDPVTGFVDLLRPRYKSVASAKDLIEKFDDIRYNNEENIFEFLLDYKKFPKTNADYQKIWTVCTNGERIKTFRNKEKNNNWDNKTVILTDEFKDLFRKFNIDYSRDDLKEQILQQNEKEFFERFLKNLSLTLQMRNSITGNQDIDYLISPVKNSDGVFFDSRNYEKWDALPCDADANGAYNIARKALWAINQLKQSEDVSTAKLSITQKEWLEYAQKR